MIKEDLWQTALSNIELNTSKANFTTWFKNTSIATSKDSSVVISVPNGFSKEWLENKFYKLILRTLREISPDIKEVTFIIQTKKSSETQKSALNTQKLNPPPYDLSDQLAFDQLNIDKETNLNPKYTFDTFVV